MTAKSAKPDSSNINPSSSNNAATLSSQRTGTSLDLPITYQANAHPAQDEISEVGSSLTSDSPSLAHAGRDKVAEIGSPSIPSAPSPEKLRDHAERAREAAEGVNEESDVAELYAVFDLISQLSDFIKKEKQDKKKKKIKEKEKKKKKKRKEKENNLSQPKLAIGSSSLSRNLRALKEVLYEAIDATKDFALSDDANKLSEPKLAIDTWLRSKNLLKLKEVLCEAINAAKDSASSGDAKKMVRGFLKDIGGGHVFNIVFIVVANAWERYEDMSENEEACLSLLEEINKFAQIIIDLQKELQNYPKSKKKMEDLVKEAIESIIEACIACCTQIEASKKSRYFRTTGGGGELTKLEKQLEQTYTRIQLTMIMEAAKEVDKENIDGDFSDLINYISRLFDFIEHGGEKPSPVSTAKYDWLDSNSLIKLKEVMSGAAETAKDLCPDAKTIARRALQGMGRLQMLATGFLVVGNLMERYENISDNKEECLRLLERMNNLIQEVKQLKERPGLMEAMEAKIKEAMELIIEVSLACCTQIDRPKYKKFFSTNVNTKELLCFQTRLTELHRKIQLQMNFGLHDLRLRVPPCPRASEEFRRENRAQIKTVTERLKLESEERAVAVILYGLGGTGKTALADAVYWSMYHEKVLSYRNHEEVLECKYSYVRLFDSITSVPYITELQTQVLQDLGSLREIRRYEEGQGEIGSILEKEVVFIYIDNVLQGLDALENLLPRTTEKVKKLRLLITTPDKGAAVRACNNLGIETELYPIEPLEDTKAMQLVKEELNGWDEKLDSNQINQIVQICGGIPKLLIKVAAYIGFSGNREEAQERYHQVISKIENFMRDEP